jgi:acetyl esterase/lipase
MNTSRFALSFFVAVIPLMALPTFSQTQSVDSGAEPQTILLWDNGAPGALGTAPEDKPSLTIYRSLDRQGGALHPAVIVAPGGGYGRLATNHEGRQVANWLNAAGITAFVLKYRLGPKYHHPIELQDAQRAINDT